MNLRFSSFVSTEKITAAQVGQPRQSQAFPLASVATGLAHASKVFSLEASHHWVQKYHSHPFA